MLGALLVMLLGGVIQCLVCVTGNYYRIQLLTSPSLIGIRLHRQESINLDNSIWARPSGLRSLSYR